MQVLRDATECKGTATGGTCGGHFYYLERESHGRGAMKFLCDNRHLASKCTSWIVAAPHEPEIMLFRPQDPYT